MAKPIPPRIVEDAPLPRSRDPRLRSRQARNGSRQPSHSHFDPGWDIAPFTTLSQYITKDPTPRAEHGHLPRAGEGTRRLGMNPSLECGRDLYPLGENEGARREAARRSDPRRAAVCGLYLAQKVPEAAGRAARGGGLVGAPINVERRRPSTCSSRARAEIVVEGISTPSISSPKRRSESRTGHVNLQE